MLYLYVCMKDGAVLHGHDLRTVTADTDKQAIERAAALNSTDILDGATLEICRFGGMSLTGIKVKASGDVTMAGCHISQEG